MPDSLPKLFGIDEVAESVGLSKNTIRKLVRDGKLRPIRICRRLRFDAASIAELVNQAR